MSSAFVLGTAGTALAGTAAVSPSQNGSTVTFTDNSGPDAIENNDVTFTVVNNRIRVRESGTDAAGHPLGLTAGAGCTQVPGDSRAADCSPSATSIVAATLAAGNDAARNQSGRNGNFSGGDGNDSLQGGSANDSLDGGTGADELSGGAGTDTATYASRTAGVFVTMDGIGNDGEGCPNLLGCEGDNVAADVENVTGGAGDDFIDGNGLVNVLRGGDGNDVLIGEAGDDNLGGGNGDDDLQGGDGADTLAGNAGSDTADYSDHGADVTANLTDGSESSTQDGNGGDSIGGDIENLTGGAGNDQLTGFDNADPTGGGDNVLDGGPGDDTLLGGPGGVNGSGADEFIGGSGKDTVPYGASGEQRSDDLTITEDDQANDAGEGDNVHGDVEVIEGGTGNDTITGSNADNTLQGGDGDDTLDGGGGADLIDGQAGNDTASYASHTDDVKITLAASSGADDGAPGEGDEIRNTENALGGAGNDTLIGDAGGNSLAGGAGIDTADYSDRNAVVTVTLDGAADDGEAGEGDNVQPDVENVKGGSANDVISGFGAVNNRFDGGPGDDTLNGGPGEDDLHGGPGVDAVNGQGGDDNLDGGEGADTLAGSIGSDTADYSSRTSPVTVTFDGDANDGEPGENDTVALDVENAIGGSGDDTLTGNDLPNVLTGGDGSDTLSGAGGPDTINSRDAFVDNVTCGDDLDTVVADKLDNIGSDCETLQFPEVPGQPPGQTPPGQTPPGQKPPTTTPPGGRVLPRSLSVQFNPKRDRRAPYRFVIAGVVNPPTSLTRQTACSDGRVSAQFKVGSRTISTRRASIDFRCRFRITVSFANRRRLGRGRLKVTVRFLGNTRMRPLAAKSQNLRAG